MLRKLDSHRRRMGNRGFSLVELIIVIAILAVLVAILAPQYIKYVEQSRKTADDASASEILNAVKVAVTNEDIYSAIPAGGATVTWNGASISDSIGGSIKNEVLNTIGGVPEIKSKAYDGKTYTITITFASDGTPTMTDGWS